MPDVHQIRQSWSGSGEERNEVLQVMDDLRSRSRLITSAISTPSPKHHGVARTLPPTNSRR